MSRRRPSCDPCELPRESLFDKTYRAALMGDGSVLPIEERLGRRLLRTIEPDSNEGRRLLRDGRVVLRRETDEWSGSIQDALDRLEREAREGLGEGKHEGRRQLDDTLGALERRRRDYS
jgi:hypothetical protein